jgi:hypothetical protein
MLAIKTKIDSDELKLDELSDFIGKEVTITIAENFEEEKLSRFFEGAGKIDLDEEEVLNLREMSKI